MKQCSCIYRRFSSGVKIESDLFWASSKENFLVNTRKKQLLTKGPPKSAVLVPLVMTENRPAVLFTVRSMALNSHRGEVSFPGGNIDSTDLSPVSAALRETQEEIGIDKSNIDIWGELPAMYGRDGKSPIVPVVGVIKLTEKKLMSSMRKSAEVAEVFTESIETLCDSNGQFYTQFRSPTGGYSIPVFLVKKRIWGITAMILHSALLALVPQDHYKPNIRFIKPILPYDK